MRTHLRVRIWNSLPGTLKFLLSRCMRFFCGLSVSALLIPSFAAAQGLDMDQLERDYESGGGEGYSCFQDFFTRKKKNLVVESSAVWPCDGRIADFGRAMDMAPSFVKGEHHDVSDIFETGFDSNSYFVNIFLHNKDYHRIHAPVRAEITEVVHRPGDLLLLRPWFYGKDRSRPAFVNERIIVRMRDSFRRDWHMAIVGGPGVATIRIGEKVRPGGIVDAGEEIGLFEIGSTVCLLTPGPIPSLHYLLRVKTGGDLRMSFRGGEPPTVRETSSLMGSTPLVDSVLNGS